VPELPPYRAADAEESDPSARKIPWTAIGIAIVVVALLVLMVILHVTGVIGPRIHGG